MIGKSSTHPCSDDEWMHLVASHRMAAVGERLLYLLLYAGLIAALPSDWVFALDENPGGETRCLYAGACSPGKRLLQIYRRGSFRACRIPHKVLARVHTICVETWILTKYQKGNWYYSSSPVKPTIISSVRCLEKSATPFLNAINNLALRSAYGCQKDTGQQATDEVANFKAKKRLDDADLVSGPITMMWTFRQVRVILKAE